MLDGLDLLLILGGAGAGFVNTVAGGGSALTLPLLMLTGLDARDANATNRIAVVLQGASGAWTFHQRGMRPWQETWRILPASLLGAAIGAGLATVMPPLALERLFGVVFLSLAVVMIGRPTWIIPAVPEGEAQPTWRGHLAFFGIGLYGGLFQAGVGIALLIVIVRSLHVDLVRATAVKVALVLIYTLVALAIFAWRGHLDWHRGLVLAAGSAVGSVVGVRMALRSGAKFIRVMVTLALLAASARTLGLF
ncbi:MAG: sulfite exporter TauE/SafE family protein [Myxococcales bacterium]|nr:sulfite exporter TauE/SafE family protein [Myxococcales bacterium]